MHKGQLEIVLHVFNLASLTHESHKMASSCNLLETNQTHCLFAHILVKCLTAIWKSCAMSSKNQI